MRREPRRFFSGVWLKIPQLGILPSVTCHPTGVDLQTLIHIAA
jgi:hypothetical protein